MFGSTVLEVVTGLVFVFLLVSLICTSIGNKISDLLKWRAIELENGIRAFILDDMKDVDMQKLATGIRFGVESYTGPTLKDLYNHPLIKPLAIKETAAQKVILNLLSVSPRGSEKPVSIPTETFVLALFDTFVPNSSGLTTVQALRKEIEKMPEGFPLRGSLLAFTSSLSTDIGDVRSKLETWFNYAMAQTTEIYKRNMWRLAVVIGILTSIVLNVDAIGISSALWRDPALRASVAAAATQYNAAMTDKTTADQAKVFNEVLAELNKLSLPIGWQLSIRTNFVLYPNDFAQSAQPVGGTAWFLKILGWVATGLAAAQGAPFWFDMFKKLTPRDSAAK